MFELIYISELSPSVPLSSIAGILTEAKFRNARRGITGVLVFDGQRFVQHFEGERADVLPLFRRIEDDPRHTQIRWLHDATITTRQYEDFRAGYWYTQTEGEAIASIGSLSGETLKDAIFSRLSLFDLAA